ncbi:MAG: signal peptidase I, partial [Clostridia bacterium]
LFAFKLVSVDGESMRETLQHMDSLVISELSNNYVTGDVIVVRSPSHTNPLVKRVIATEGQTVEIDFENWIIKVDGVVLDEPYITGMREHRNMKGYEYYNGKFTVQEGKIYVMGDNRNNSTDSRDPTVGQLDQRSILGKVVLRVFPLDKFGKIK